MQQPPHPGRLQCYMKASEMQLRQCRNFLDASSYQQVEKPTVPTLIEELINENTPIWNEFMNNKFCLDGYTKPGSDFDPVYRNYAKQDYLYLLDFVRVTNYLQLQDPRTTHNYAPLRKMGEDIVYFADSANSFRELCEKEMGIGATEMATIVPSHAEIAYASWEQKNASTQDAFSSLIMLIPCLYGWNKIALQLQGLQDVPVDTNSLFYKYWFQDSLNPKWANIVNNSVEEYRGYFESPYTRAKWSKIFHDACLMEIAFFQEAFSEDN